MTMSFFFVLEGRTRAPNHAVIVMVKTAMITLMGD